jgi:hypothetical protein
VQRVTPELDKDMGQQATSVPNELFFSRLLILGHGLDLLLST